MFVNGYRLRSWQPLECLLRNGFEYIIVKIFQVISEKFQTDPCESFSHGSNAEWFCFSELDTVLVLIMTDCGLDYDYGHGQHSKRSIKGQIDQCESVSHLIQIKVLLVEKNI